LRRPLIDAGAPVVVVTAEAFGLTGAEPPAAIDADDALLARLERIRRASAHCMGLVHGDCSVPRAIPKIALVAPPLAQRDISGRTVAADDHDLSVRTLSIGHAHPALAVTTGVALALAATTPGTVVSNVLFDAHPARPLRLATPSGVLPIWVEHSAEGQIVSVLCTARRLLTAYIDVPRAAALAVP